MAAVYYVISVYAVCVALDVCQATETVLPSFVPGYVVLKGLLTIGKGNIMDT